MSWLSDFVRPKIQRLVQRREVPDNLWDKCPQCGHMIFHRDMARTQSVCQHCDYHLRLSVKARLDLLFDQAAYQRLELPKSPADPLKFKDTKRYADRLRDQQSKTGENDAIIVAEGSIGGCPAVVAAFNFAFMGGSMGCAVGDGINAAADLAVAREAALIVVPASGGARMQEGILSLMQMARTTVAVDKVKDRGLPYIVLLTDPTTGGVSASFAMLGDIHIAEPGAVIGFAGARVIETTIREKLPEGFQRAEYLLEHGMVDMVVHRHHLAERIGRLLALLRHKTDAVPPLALDTPDVFVPDGDYYGDAPSADP
jgi:acetyl-CoA carboxylase carboxyl transferase subunit beta